MTTSKSIALAGTLAVIGVLFWYVLRVYFLTGISTTAFGLVYTPALIGVVVLLFAFLVLYGLSIALIPSNTIWNVSWVLFGLGGFAIAPSILTAIGTGLLIIVGPIMRYRGRQSLRYGIGRSLYIPLRNAFPTMLTIFALLIALTFPALEPQAPESLEVVIPEQLFLTALGYTDETLALELSAFDSEARFDEYALNFAAQELGLNPESFSLSQRLQIVNEAEKSIETKFNIDIDTTKTLGEVLYAGGISRLNEATAPYIQFFPYVTAIGLFLLLRFAFFFVRIIVVIITALLIKLAIGLGIARTIAMQHTVSYPTF